MNTAQNSIWKAHQERLAVISREIVNREKKYYNDQKAMASSFGGLENVPQDQRKNLDEKFSEDMAALKKKEHAEIVRVQDEFKDHDKKKELNIEELNSPPDAQAKQSIKERAEQIWREREEQRKKDKEQDR